jgi:CDP-glucose 4,6-dehydratase
MVIRQGPVADVVMNRSFWKGKRVFLTGHTGFKGAWLSLWLQESGANLTGYSLAPSTTPSLFEAGDVANGMTSTIGDIRDPESLLKGLRQASPEIVFHLAAQPLVRQSYANPVETYATNVMGLVHLLEGVKATSSVRVLVNVTSDKCYENHEWPWGYRETDRVGGHDPYSSSKACAELITTSYRAAFFNPGEHPRHGVAIATARAGNVIGGGDWAEDRLVPDILRAIDDSRSVEIRNPDSIRPWQHVLEPLAGYLMLAEKLHCEGPEFGGAWNFGPNEGDCKTVRWVTERLMACWGRSPVWQKQELEPLHEATFLKLDCSKARSRLDWQPRWDLRKALDQVVSWHQQWRQGRNMRSVSIEQIHEYETNSAGASA